MSSIIKEFLLFDFPTAYTYGDQVLKICSHAIFPIFVFSLIFDKASRRSDPMGILKRVIIAQFILFTLPIYYKDVAGFGLKVGDSIIKEQQSGLIVNWLKFKEKAARKIKNKKEVTFLTTVSNFFKFKGTDYVEKAAAILIFFCMVLIKIIYSAVYYIAYCTSGILAVLSIFPLFSGYSIGILKSILYLIVTAILVALVLTFMSTALDFNVSRDGFIEGLTGIAQFLVLCFVLLGSLKIGQSVVNASGPEGWAGNMGSMLGAGLAFKSMGMVTDLAKQGGEKGVSFGAKFLGKNASAMVPVASSLAYMASRPFVAGAKNIASSVQSSVADKTDQIAKDKNINSSSFSNIGLKNNNESLSSSSLNKMNNSPLLNNRYENSFNKIASDKNGKVSITSSLNLINHAKASVDATKGLSHALMAQTKNKLGIPEYSKNLSMKEKAIFTAHKMINNSAKLDSKELLKSQITANRVSKTMDENNDRKT